MAASREPMSKLCVSALICFRVFYEASRTSTRNHPHDPTTSKPVVPGGMSLLSIEADSRAKLGPCGRRVSTGHLPVENSGLAERPGLRA